MEKFTYRVYVTDSLQLAGQNKYLTTRWAEMQDIGYKDARTGDEIALDVIKRAGLKFNGN